MPWFSSTNWNCSLVEYKKWIIRLCMVPICSNFIPVGPYATVSFMRVLTPLNLQADKLIILIIFFLPNNEEFSFLGTSLEICAVSNFWINDLRLRAVSFFLLSHNISEHARGVRNEAIRYKLPLSQSLLLCIINLHMFTFSLTARGSEERRTTARGLLKVARTIFPLFLTVLTWERTNKKASQSVGWFSRALAFRSLYYPWGKMGTTHSLRLHPLMQIRPSVNQSARVILGILQNDF